MAITYDRADGRFGAVVHGLDLAGDVTDDDLRELLGLLQEHRFLILPGQILSNDQYVAFGRRWGRPVLLISRSKRLVDHPEMILQANSPSTPEFLRNSANNWHCDSSYEEEVASVTMLYGVESPEQGGETLFADLVAAYEALPDEKRMIYDKLLLRHAPGGAQALPDEYVANRERMPEEIRQTISMPDPVVHSLVRANPYDGRKAFYGVGGSSFGIVGMDDDEAAELLIELRRFVTQEHFVSRCKLMPNDVLIWDNFSVMHRATPIDYTDEPGRRRRNYRISVKGLPDFAVA